MTYLYVDAPADRTSVISSIVDFAVANAGFALVDGSGDFQCISKGGLYWCFNPESLSSASKYQIAARLTSVVPSSSDYLTVTGQYKVSGFGMYSYSGPYVGLHLFSNGDEVGCVLEIANNIFSHLNFGQIDKFGTYTGGQYITGSVYAPSDNFCYCPWNQGLNPFDGGLFGGGGRAANFRNVLYYESSFCSESAIYEDKRVVWGGVYSTCNTPLFNVGYAGYNYRRPLLPMYAMIEETGARSKMIGVSENVRYVNLDGLLNKEVIESDWMVFPYAQRTHLIGTYFTGTANPGDHGLAYKK